uniref:Uncharacterized protein n=1 Tax=Oryza brachyantha TaxID=4533 RepID=J3M5R9_ORYBR
MVLGCGTLEMLNCLPITSPLVPTGHNLYKQYLKGHSHGCMVRFHYDHPNIFDRMFHLTRGGISKVSKTINLSV